MCNNDRIVKFIHKRLTTRMHSSMMCTDRVQWPPLDLSIGGRGLPRGGSAELGGLLRGGSV